MIDQLVDLGQGMKRKSYTVAETDGLELRQSSYLPVGELVLVQSGSNFTLAKWKEFARKILEVE